MLFQLHRRRSSPFLRQNPRHMHFSDRFNQRLRGTAGGMLATLTFLALNWGAVHDCLREKLVFRFWQSYTLCTLFFFSSSFSFPLRNKTLRSRGLSVRRVVWDERGEMRMQVRSVREEIGGTFLSAHFQIILTETKEFKGSAETVRSD